MTLATYSFSLPTRIEFGPGVSRTAAAEAKVLGAKKVLLVADKGVIGAGLTDAVQAELKKENIPFALYDKIVPNPRDFDCMAGYEFAKEEQADVIITIGGGSSMDTAKAIGVLLTHGGRIQDWCGFQLLQRDITPVIAIPTTAGTGSEVTPFAVITDSDIHVKLNVFDPRCAPRVALVDPEMILKLPSHIMASCGIDAMTHAVEAYTCKVASPHTDANAVYAMKIIAENLVKAVHEPDLASCTGMMLGSTIAGIAFGFADVGAVHCMAEALGGRYDTPHGVANAVFLPTVIEFNAPADYQKHADVAGYLGVDTRGMTVEEAAQAAADALGKLCRDVDIPKFRELPDVDPADFEALSVAAEKNVSTPSNVREIKAADFLALFQKAYAL